jgi:hypothetical protein
MPRPTPGVPFDLQELSGRFEDWRRTRRGKLPIPGPLWAAAADLTRFARRAPDGPGAAIGVQKAQAVDGRGSGWWAGSASTCSSGGNIYGTGAPTERGSGVCHRVGRATGQAAHPVERGKCARPSRTQPRMQSPSARSFATDCLP